MPSKILLPATWTDEQIEAFAKTWNSMPGHQPVPFERAPAGAKDIIQAARLLRAAAEDAQVALKALPKHTVTSNFALVGQQVLVNLNHALTAAERAGIERADTIAGDCRP